MFTHTRGCELIQEFQERGAFLYQSWPRSAEDRSTRVSVHFDLSSGGGDKSKLLLFDHSRAVATITMSGGRVINVAVQDS